MMANPKKVIDVAAITAPVISSRDIIQAIAEAVNLTDAPSVDLDFSNVEFISRSAAHELLKLKEDLHRKRLKKKTISFVNANQDVAEMLRVVAANMAVPKNPPKLKPKETDIFSISKE